MRTPVEVTSPAEKKAYRKPELVVYGDVREVTQTFALGMGSEDATMGVFKTQPMA